MPTPAEQEQIRKDRQTVVRGAAIASVAGLGAAALLRKGRGGVKRVTPAYPGGGRLLPAPVAKASSGRGDKVARTREVIRLPQHGVVKGSSVLGPRMPTRREAAQAGPRKPTAAENQARKGGESRAIQAANLREKRAWSALKPSSPAKLAKATPSTREIYGRMHERAKSARFNPPAGTVTAKEASRADRAKREAERQKLLKFRQQKNLSEDGGGFGTPFTRHFKERDRSDTARDVAVAGGAIAGGAAAVHSARQIAKTNRNVRTVVPRFTPQEIARAVGAEVSAKTRKTVKGYFPTFVKGGKKVSALMKKHVFETPASRLIEFGGRDQLKEVDSNRYGDPLKAAAGLQKVYTRKDAGGRPVVEDQPLAHAQTIKAALRKGEKISRAAGRGGRLAKDVADTVRGKPRERDAAGRARKKEWEKSWFKEGVKKAAVGAGVLGYVGLLRKSPRARNTHQRVVKKVTETANRYVPDLVPRTHFSTPASHHFEDLTDADTRKKARVKEKRKTENAARIRNTLVGATAGSFLGGGLYGGKSGYGGARIGAALGGAYGALSNPKRRAAIDQLQTASFSTRDPAYQTPAGRSGMFDGRVVYLDEQASAAGWDVRDPRGKSARVFAPGSRRRNRRPKEWHEKASNERKLWKAGLVTAAVGAGALGVAVGRKMPVAPENVIKVKFPKRVSG